MTRSVLRFPEDVKEFFARQYRRRHSEWLAGGGTWPLIVPLGSPTESETQLQRETVSGWVAAWRAWQGAGQLLWHERRWRSLGAQSVPDKLVAGSAEIVAQWIGEEQRWRRASSRYRLLVARWPELGPRLPRYFESLADYPDRDMARLEALLAWLAAHPRSNLYPRQLPIAGLDTKWLEPRMPLVADLLAAFEGEATGAGSLLERCGLREAPHIVRMRLLDPSLRACVGGLADISAPIGELAALRLPVSRVYIVENIQTGLCFEDRAGSAVFMGLGYGANVLARLPWVSQSECIYWGDLDTHGFAILSRLRAFLPRLASRLMDEATLLQNRDLWVEEKEQYNAGELPFLTAAEQAVYQGLKQQRWGLNVRLEQERLAWPEAWREISE